MLTQKKEIFTAGRIFVFRRIATIEFSPVFQGWDQAPTTRLFVA
jgi:hypothetical protein